MVFPKSTKIRYCKVCGNVFRQTGNRAFCSDRCKTIDRCRICKFCGIAFYSIHKNIKYCSRQCQLRGRSKKGSRIECFMCGKMHYRSPAQIKKTYNFCSSECAKKAMSIGVGPWKQKGRGREANRCRYNNHKVELICFHCGKKFKRLQSKIRNSRQFCSKACLKQDRKPKYGGSTGRYNKRSVRFKVLQRDGFRCVYCGRSPKEDGIKLHLDHVLPKSLGGKDTADNLVSACEDCNLGKSDTMMDMGNFPIMSGDLFIEWARKTMPVSTQMDLPL